MNSSRDSGDSSVNIIHVAKFSDMLMKSQTDVISMLPWGGGLSLNGCIHMIMK